MLIINININIVLIVVVVVVVIIIIMIIMIIMIIITIIMIMIAQGAQPHGRALLRAARGVGPPAAKNPSRYCGLYHKLY